MTHAPVIQVQKKVVASLKVHKYQKIVMRSKARFRVVVAGRRWGKCIADDTLITMADGGEKRVQDVRPGDWVLTVNQDSYRLEPRQVWQLLDNGVRETVAVRTAGRELRVTPNHPILANNRWIEAGDLRPGDLVAVPRDLAVAPIIQHKLPITETELRASIERHVEQECSAGRSEARCDAIRAFLMGWDSAREEYVSARRYTSLRGYSDGYFDPIADGDLVWEEVISVTAAPAVQTWDLALPDNHNFVAGGIITHNSQVSKISLIKEAASRSRQLVWYVAPTYQMARDIMWEDLKASLPRIWIRKINETRMVIHLANGSRIHLKGADKPDTLRGVGLNFVVIDEAQDIKEETWELVLQPTLATTNGRAIFIGTPKSYNWLYHKYMLGQRGPVVKDVRGRNVANEWESWQFPTITSPFIPLKEIEARRRDMDPKSFAQEFEACHLPETEVQMFDGSHRAIRDVRPGDLVAHLGEDGVVVPTEVLRIGETGEKVICDAVLETGEVVSASAHHKFKVAHHVS